ncbi:tRNA (adenosine(37)-N6)-threonylcarbamoyltransferase complex dimerization subunit type 1 TsaB [Chromobacterium haemolyticum]|uniref:tRNA (adenosine(37)-N6)-threonylcarbamoyltransferase complex dimerization subunit type 1 TsaB n=1 Tax=Chromobacterium haemolyticum TaxID=394935 RepID=UPI0009DAB29F|nr:tRNA (adenosine(37)-N6)-threonylcarbamoyltransferase complex dimerization subunit type 1 TsaB [Chromobacterium haemolyticum]OQS41192.1 tRNA (adenosine(37)-N6)-threonylcarbamoyltransferase complex dimerization subunit type 1 TsaB [Chromobacterium haemolyticum]
MKLLAIDCSTSFLSLAIDNGSRIFSFHEKVEQKHAERALPELARLLEQAELRLEQLDAIAFGQGPGSFTGLRIACGLAQGLAFSAGLPVIGIPTLDNIAQQAGAGTVLVCLDARMQQVYSASYRVTGKDAPERLCPIGVGAPKAVPWPERADIAAGDGFERYPDLQNNAGSAILRADLLPNAVAYFALARSGRYPQTHPREAELLYVRNKVALTAQEQQQARQK